MSSLTLVLKTPPPVDAAAMWSGMKKRGYVPRFFCPGPLFQSRPTAGNIWMKGKLRLALPGSSRLGGVLTGEAGKNPIIQ